LYSPVCPSTVPNFFTHSMPPKPLKWHSGTRGPYPGQWLVYRDEDFSRFIQTPDSENVQPTVGPRGDIRPWDWCRDILYFDPTQPWLAFIPTFDPADYQNSAQKQSWIFPNHSNDPGNYRASSRGGYTASVGLIEHATTWLPKIKRLAEDLAQAHRWPHPLPDIPNTKMLALRLESSDGVLAHLWGFRRPSLSLLGFIHYFLSNHYIAAELPVRNCPVFQDKGLHDFVCNHLFTGQSFRGVLIETERFCQHYESNPVPCEPILQLLDPKLKSPIPLVIHRPQSCSMVRVPQLNAVFSLRTLQARLGKQTSYMMKECSARNGIHIDNSKIAARARAYYHYAILQSEMDGVNLILFFFDKPLRPVRNSSSTGFEEGDEDEDEDVSDLPELEPADFHYFRPEKLRRIPDAVFSFDLGGLGKLLATLSEPQQPAPGKISSSSNLFASHLGE
jgi:hypothetical protein